jgi:hypothetical protein
MHVSQWGELRKILLLTLSLRLVAVQVQGATELLTIQVPHGLSTIANPFEGDSNTVDRILTPVPEGTQLYKFDATSQRWSVNQWQFGGWTDPAQRLEPGEGAFIRNLSNEFQVTFTGIVPTNFQSQLPGGFSMASVPVGGIESLTPNDNDRLYAWDSLTTNYVSFDYFAGIGWFGNSGPYPPDGPVRPGEAFFYKGFLLPTPLPPPLLPSVYFNNYAPADGVDSPVTSTLGCIGDFMMAQLYWGRDPDFQGFQPLGSPVRLLPSSSGAYIDAASDLVRSFDFSPQFRIWLQVRAWDIRGGATYEAAGAQLLAEYDWGRGQVFEIDGVASCCPPSLPVNLAGLPTSYAVGRIDAGPYYANPTNTVAVDGEAVILDAQLWILTAALGTIQWQKQIDSNTWSNVGGATNWSMTIPSVTASNAGTYRVDWRRDCAIRLSPPRDLIVIGRPKIETPALRSPDGALVLKVELAPSLSYAVEVSENLSDWLPLAQITNAPALWEIVETHALARPQQYYRVSVTR